MKTYGLLFFAGLPLLAACVTARADLIAQDTFAGYPKAEFPQKASGEGWKARWLVRDGVSAEVETAPGPDGEPASCLKVSGTNSVSAIARRIESPGKFAGDSVFLRVVFEIGESGDDAPVFGAWTFGDAENYREGLPMVTTTLKGTPSARLGEANQSLVTQLKPGTIHVLVAELGGWNEATKRYTTVSLWLDPKPGESKESQPHHATATGDTGCGPFEMLYFRTHQLGVGFYRFFDVKLATSWEDVVS